VAALSPVPVFIVRGAALEPPAAAEAEGAAAGQRFVAIAVDGASPGSALLTRWAVTHALRPSDAVLLCHKAPPPARDAAAAAAAEAEVRRCADLLTTYFSEQASAGGRLVDGTHFASEFDVRDALVDLSESGIAGGPPGPPALLILGSRGPAALKRLALGSVAAYVVRHADCALALVPPIALLEPGV
jgi:nucleotide-binding universal stress UspA family protein